MRSVLVSNRGFGAMKQLHTRFDLILSQSLLGFARTCTLIASHVLAIFFTTFKFSTPK